MHAVPGIRILVPTDRNSYGGDSSMSNVLEYGWDC